MARYSENLVIGLGIQRSILTQFGVATSTGIVWDLQKFCDKIKEDPGVKNKFNIFQLIDMEMAMLGFAPVGDGRNLRLIPCWLYQFLPDQVLVYGRSSDEPELKDKTTLGAPVSGFFGFAVLPRDKKLRDDQPEVVTPKEKEIVTSSEEK